MFFQVKQYLSFLKNSTTKYGIHSPFIFNLVTECFNSNDLEINLKNRRYREYLLQNNKIIEIEDFGAGSKKLKKDNRKISDIVKKAGITYKNSNLLSRIIKYFNSSEILEIGTSLGMATYSMYAGNSKANITTLEGCQETLSVAKESLSKFNANNITFVKGNFNKTLPKLVNKKYDLIYFDGNHKKEATISYFETCLNTIYNGTVFIFDDIYWSKEMQEAWEYIKNHKKVIVTIDTFYWGIVFFRVEQEKQHFKIRL